MAQKTEEWSCHPDLEVEWDLFTENCRRNTRTDFNSELWMKFWQQSNVPSKPTINLGHAEPFLQDKGFHEAMECDDTELPSISNPPSANLVVEDNVAALTDSQQQQINAIVSDLLDVFDMASESIPEELKDDIKLLPSHAVSLLFKELSLRLSDQGFYSICSVLSEDTNPDSWVDIRLVFQEIFLPMLSGEKHNTLGEEVKAGLKQLTERFPSECVSHMLIPLLSYNLTAPTQLELLSDLIPALPKSDFSGLFRDFILQCKAPLEELKILVLICFMSTSGVDDIVLKTDSPLLKLLPVLSLSARALSANESFASLILRIIPALRCSTSPQVQNEITAIVQQSASFNKQAMLNALKG